MSSRKMRRYYTEAHTLHVHHDLPPSPEYNVSQPRPPTIPRSIRSLLLLQGRRLPYRRSRPVHSRRCRHGTLHPRRFVRKPGAMGALPDVRVARQRKPVRPSAETSADRTRVLPNAPSLFATGCTEGRYVDEAAGVPWNGRRARHPPCLWTNRETLIWGVRPNERHPSSRFT
jgi:hypothetical protein